MSKDKEAKPRWTILSSLAAWLEKIPPEYRLILTVTLPVAVLVIVGIGLLADNPPAAPPVEILQTPTHPASPTATSDPCSTELIRGDVEAVHGLMLEFYDASALASQTPAEQLPQMIPNLQEIRRRAQALKVSHCLDDLRSYQISHMNMVINTLMAFMSKADQSVLVEGIIQARLLNEEYKKEKARLLGEKYIPPATPIFTPTAGTETPSPSATP
jgi:hypothetical protein